MSRIFFALAFVLMAMMLPIAQAEPFETGWLNDEKGAADPKTSALVVVVASMNGTRAPDGSMKWAGRHIGVEIPSAGIDLKTLVLIGEDGKSIPHRYPEVLADSFLKSGKKGTYLKLFVDHTPGFKFKIHAE